MARWRCLTSRVIHPFLLLVSWTLTSTLVLLLSTRPPARSLLEVDLLQSWQPLPTKTVARRTATVRVCVTTVNAAVCLDFLERRANSLLAPIIVRALVSARMVRVFAQQIAEATTALGILVRLIARVTELASMVLACASLGGPAFFVTSPFAS